MTGFWVLAAAEEHGKVSLFAGDLGVAIWTLVIFVLVLFVLGRFAWGPILTVLQRREDFIRESLASAKREREEAEVRLREYVEKVEHARVEATSIVEGGRRDAEEVRRKVQSEARSESDAMIERARREIKLARDTAVKELYALTAELATDVASRIVRKELNADDQRRLVEEALAEWREKGGNGRW